MGVDPLSATALVGSGFLVGVLVGVLLMLPTLVNRESNPPAPRNVVRLKRRPRPVKRQPRA